LASAEDGTLSAITALFLTRLYRTVLYCTVLYWCRRGPGIVLGDDAVRDRRLAVGVVAAEDGVVTLRVSPQKFVATLDPLTLRLFSRLRQQQDGALQVCRGRLIEGGQDLLTQHSVTLCP
jgi:hypothetical protein